LFIYNAFKYIASNTDRIASEDSIIIIKKGKEREIAESPCTQSNIGAFCQGILKEIIEKGTS
jgi:hypothetical protein